MENYSLNGLIKMISRGRRSKSAASAINMARTVSIPIDRRDKVRKQQYGKQFDPDLVDIFLNNLPEFVSVIERYVDD